jgi:hypothetical protein
MAKSFQPSVLTGNALESGLAVWWTGAGWSEDFAEARAARTPDQAATLEALAAAPLVQSMVVGPYLAPVAEEGGRILPGSRREAIRAGGVPTFAYAAAEEALEKAA